MPTLLDTEEMPYLQAVTKEVMRLNPAVPMSMPHATMEDDVHDGYFIPKGAMVLPNLWYVLFFALHEFETGYLILR
jgi:cytochrome P450